MTHEQLLERIVANLETIKEKQEENEQYKSELLAIHKQGGCEKTFHTERGEATLVRTTRYQYPSEVMEKIAAQKQEIKQTERNAQEEENYAIDVNYHWRIKAL